MRLIDADALKYALKQYYTNFIFPDGVTARQLFNQILHDIDNAPTVIVDSCGKCPYYKDHDRDIITEAYNDGYKTAKEDFENHKLVNNSQELVKDLVKEKSERPQGECANCDFRKFAETFVVGVVDVMNKNGITSVEQLSEILKGGAE